jgi:hypothetical protein
MVSDPWAVDLRAPHTDGRGLRSSDAKKSGKKNFSFKPGSRERKTEALEASPTNVRDPQTPGSKRPGSISSS